MPFAIHTVEIPDGGIINNFDRVIIGGQIGIASAAGGGAGESVTTAVIFPAQLGGLPPTYAVLVTPNQECNWWVTNKTASGFNVVLAPVTGTLPAGSFDVVVIG